MAKKKEKTTKVHTIFVRKQSWVLMDDIYKVLKICPDIVDDLKEIERGLLKEVTKNN